MYSLTFEDKTQYKYFYIGLMMSKLELTKVERRTHTKLMDKVEGIGIADNNGVYNLKETGLCISLEDAQYDLAKRLIENMSWPVADSRIVVKLEDWLENAQQIDSRKM